MSFHFLAGTRVSVLLGLCLGAVFASGFVPATAAGQTSLTWEELPPLPDALGVAGPFVGVHQGALVVAGGANFPQPVWETNKAWHDRIYVLTKHGEKFSWHDGGKLTRSVAYGAAVSTSQGILCIGGNDSEQTFREVFLLQWDPDKQQISQKDYPRLPRPCAYGQATLIGDSVYLAGGQHDLGLDSAMRNFWRLNLSAGGDATWEELEAWPAASRALNLTVSQSNGVRPCVYVMSGRREENDRVEFLRDVWEFDPQESTWRARKELPRCVMAGTAIATGSTRLLVLGGADGSLFDQVDRLRDAHPGFPREALRFDTKANRWEKAGPMPRNHVTTVPVRWDGKIIVASGEVRPRVRSPKVWRISDQP